MIWVTEAQIYETAIYNLPRIAGYIEIKDVNLVVYANKLSLDNLKNMSTIAENETVYDTESLSKTLPSII